MKHWYVWVVLTTMYNTYNAFIPNDPYLPWLNCAQQLAMNVPSAFGKTHFVIGHTPEKKPQPVTTNSESRAVTNPNSDCVAFFTPDDDVRTELIKLIDQEQEAIRIAIFILTDKQITQALINAHNRKVRVEVVTDPAGLRDRQNKIGLLCDTNILVYVYHGQHAKSGNSSIMHHKFALFSKNKKNKPLLWTGSFNFTRIACDCNQENVVILDDSTLIARYTEQFNRLKKRSYRYKQTTEE